MQLPQELLTSIALYLEDIIDIGSFLAALQSTSPSFYCSEVLPGHLTIITPSFFLRQFLTHLPPLDLTKTNLKANNDELFGPKRRHVLRASLMERRLVALAASQFAEEHVECHAPAEVSSGPHPAPAAPPDPPSTPYKTPMNLVKTQLLLKRQHKLLDIVLSWLSALCDVAHQVLGGEAAFGIALTLRAGSSNPAGFEVYHFPGVCPSSASGLSPWLHKIDILKPHLSALAKWLVELKVCPDRSRRPVADLYQISAHRHRPRELSANSSCLTPSSNHSANGLWLADSPSNDSPIHQQRLPGALSSPHSGIQALQEQQRWMCLSGLPVLRKLALTQSSMVAWLRWVPKLRLPLLREVIIAPMLVPEGGVTTASWAEFFTALSDSRSVERLVLLISPTHNPNPVPPCRHSDDSPPSGRPGREDISTYPWARHPIHIIQSVAVISGILRGAVQALQKSLKRVEFGIVLQTDAPRNDQAAIIKDHVQRVKDVLTQLSTQLDTMDIEPHQEEMDFKWAVLFRPSGHELGPIETCASSSAYPSIVLDSSSQPLLSVHYPGCRHSAVPLPDLSAVI